MVSTGTDQFWVDSKPEDTVVTPKRKRPVGYTQTSSMSSPQSTTVNRGDNPNLQSAAKRRLKQLQQGNTDNSF